MRRCGGAFSVSGVTIGPNVCRSVGHMAHDLTGTLCAIMIAIIAVRPTVIPCVITPRMVREISPAKSECGAVVIVVVAPTTISVSASVAIVFVAVVVVATVTIAHSVVNIVVAMSGAVPAAAVSVSTATVVVV